MITLWLRHLVWNTAIVTVWVIYPVFRPLFSNYFADSFVTILIGFVSLSLSLYAQGVLRVRKRVTLMGVTVAAVFGICWAPDVIAHKLDVNTSLSISETAYAVIHTLILFSSAVNPFLYALVNKTFREKLVGMICCSCTSSTGSTRNRVCPPPRQSHHL